MVGALLLVRVFYAGSDDNHARLQVDSSFHSLDSLFHVAS